MKYWRMQLHPADSKNAILHTIESLSYGYIGLDFDEDPGDLTQLKKIDLPKGQTDYWDFANEMKINDIVLIVTHHFPFALVTIKEGYNYIKRKDPTLGVWFRHFRKIKKLRLYADFVTNPHSWQKLIMTDTISILKDQNSDSYKLIDNWLDSNY
jgi:hypothetical protein